MRVWRIIGLLAGSCLLFYGVSTAAIYWAMRQPPERFGAIMRHVPGVSMAILPFQPLWMKARAGVLEPGDRAPDFILSTVDRSQRVRVSDEYRTRPVVLIFGSYT
jgi:hypothetical protein